MARVGIVFEPPDGGVAEHVRQLSIGLCRDGWEVEVACAPTAVIQADLRAAGVAVHRVPFEHGLRRPVSDAKALATLLRLLRRRRYDLVHCHSIKAGVAGRLAARAARIPAVYTPHGFAFKAGRRAVRAALRRAERVLAAHTAALVCVSDAERRLAVDSGLAPRALHVVRNASEPCDGLLAPDPVLADLRASGPLAACITVLRPEKGVDRFLDAVPLVLADMPEARLAVVGSGPEEERLRLRAGVLLDDPRFRFLGFAGPAARYLRAVDAFVLASRREGMPLGVLEAMACGVPQVATAVGGTPEAVAHDTGVLVEPDDPRGLADAIVALLRDPERRKALRAGSLARHARMFTVDRLVRETAAVYRETLLRSGGPAHAHYR